MVQAEGEDRAEPEAAEKGTAFHRRLILAHLVFLSVYWLHRETTV